VLPRPITPKRFVQFIFAQPLRSVRRRYKAMGKGKLSAGVREVYMYKRVRKSVSRHTLVEIWCDFGDPR
jgi:hypothetical protein